MSTDNVRAHLRLRVAQSDVHYAGGLVDGAFLMRLFGDLATEIMIRADGDEGLFRAYETVEFLEPVQAGDYLEAEARMIGRGRTSRRIEFEVRRVIRADGALDAWVEKEPRLVAVAIGTAVSSRARAVARVQSNRHKHQEES